MTPQWIILWARPRVAPLGWPHSIDNNNSRGLVINYDCALIDPAGGWTFPYHLDPQPQYAFPDTDLDDVLERFYESAGPYPFDFIVSVVDAPEKKASKKKPKVRGRASKR